MPGTPRSYGAGSNLLPKPAGLGLCQASRAASGYGNGQQLSCRSCPGLADSVWFLPGGACQQQAGRGEASHPGGFWRRRGSVSRAFWHSCWSPPAPCRMDLCRGDEQRAAGTVCWWRFPSCASPIPPLCPGALRVVSLLSLCLCAPLLLLLRGCVRASPLLAVSVCF